MNSVINDIAKINRFRIVKTTKLANKERLHFIVLDEDSQPILHVLGDSFCCMRYRLFNVDFTDMNGNFIGNFMRDWVGKGSGCVCNANST